MTTKKIPLEPRPRHRPLVFFLCKQQLLGTCSTSLVQHVEGAKDGHPCLSHVRAGLVFRQSNFSLGFSLSTETSDSCPLQRRHFGPPSLFFSCPPLLCSRIHPKTRQPTCHLIQMTTFHRTLAATRSHLIDGLSSTSFPSRARLPVSPISGSGCVVPMPRMRLPCRHPCAILNDRGFTAPSQAMTSQHAPHPAWTRRPGTKVEDDRTCSENGGTRRSETVSSQLSV